MGGERPGGLLHIRRRRGGPVPTKVRAYVLQKELYVAFSDSDSGDS